MKLRLATLALLSALSLGGCATTGGVTGVGGITAANIATAISSVQSTAVTVCGFLPTGGTVRMIFDTLSALAGVGSVETIVANVASQICAAVAPAKLGHNLGVVQPMVNGVAVHGTWVTN